MARSVWSLCRRRLLNTVWGLLGDSGKILHRWWSSFRDLIDRFTTHVRTIYSYSLSFESLIALMVVFVIWDQETLGESSSDAWWRREGLSREGRAHAWRNHQHQGLYAKKKSLVCFFFCLGWIFVFWTIDDLKKDFDCVYSWWRVERKRIWWSSWEIDWWSLVGKMRWGLLAGAAAVYHYLNIAFDSESDQSFEVGRCWLVIN